jgi:predicted transcriptional regulator
LKLGEIRAALDAEVLAGEDMMDCEVASACASDLMSDIMYYVKKHTVLLTGLTNVHAVRTADMLDVNAIVFVGNKKPMPGIIDMAREKNIAVLATKYPMYEACGKLYSLGLPACVRNV